MIDPNAPAFPQLDANGTKWTEGLTVRAEIASRIMAGLAAAPDLSTSIPADVAKYSLQWTDALIAKLNKP